jgi:kynurenine formamidase
MKLYDLSQPLNQDAPFWPFYPPFEVKYFKRKSEHGVNATPNTFKLPTTWAATWMPRATL